MFETTVAGSLPKPLWLAEPEKLWPAWELEGDALAAGKLAPPRPFHSQFASNSFPRVSGSAKAARITMAYAIAAKMPIAGPSPAEADATPTSTGKNAPKPRPKL